MPDIRKYKSVAVPIVTWEKLGVMANKHSRSPAQQIAFLVDVAEDKPSDVEILSLYASLKLVARA